ncbi:MAG TPA: ABC transporter ATP-binding protein, partial [Bacillales bacterium]|nr:ABC transporter ATP-binding protein [Bacillales bacterium]
WETLYHKKTESQYQLLKKRTAWTFAAEVIVTITYGLSGLFSIYLIYRGQLMVGSFVAVLHSVQNIQDSLEMSSRNISDVYEKSLYVNEYRSFLAIDEESDSANKEMIEKLDRIKARNITFQYPSRNQPSISNIDLDIPIGKNITIIGQNGSGKTTLTKCLTGLYEASTGELLINGENLKNVDKTSFQKRISVLFQDYVKYMFSVKENIGFGNHENMDNDFMVRNAASKTGLFEEIEKLPYHYETQLGNIFDNGSQLSGGQWQRLALSRALFRDGDLIILDEPTSSLDPLSEIDILENLYAKATDKSIICISHRIGPALLSDEIIVMDHGRIIEKGSHDELIQLNGAYRKLYETQEKWYRRKGELPV